MSIVTIMFNRDRKEGPTTGRMTMRAFPTQAKKARDKQALDERRHPHKGRSAKDAMRVLRMCQRFDSNLAYILNDVTKYQSLPWFETADVITDRDDEAIIDWRGVVENTRTDGYLTDDSGLLVNMQDKSLQASNVIEAVTTYVDRIGDGINAHEYMLRKTVFSPFPCETWGRLPLTLHQWKVIAWNLVYSRALWQWEAALNEYAERNGLKLHNRFELEGLVGWNMVTTKRTGTDDTQEPQTWTGPIIYTLSANTVLNPQPKYGSRT